MKLSSLQDLYLNELKDLYSAENQIIKALPKMAKAASSPELQQAFQHHLDQTREHVNRLEKILEKMSQSGKRKKCKGIEGIIDEGAEMLEKDIDPAVRDAGLIAAAQRVEHYEMASYGCARTYAHILGDDEAASLLQQTLDEEGETDKKLTQLAEQVNPHAAEQPVEA